MGQGNVSTVYPLLPGRCTGAGLSLSIKTSPSLRRRRGCSRRGRVYLGLVLQVCTVTSHVTLLRGAALSHSQFTQTAHCSVYGVICSAWGPHCFLWTLLLGQDCFRRRPLLPLWSVESLDLVRGNILVVCSTLLVPTPSSASAMFSSLQFYFIYLCSTLLPAPDPWPRCITTFPNNAFLHLSSKQTSGSKHK